MPNWTVLRLLSRMFCKNSAKKYIYLYILASFICLAQGNGSFLNIRNRDYGVQRSTNSNQLLKTEDGSSSGNNGNRGLDADGSIRSVGEVFVPKTFPVSSQEPSCEQLRAMWIFSKRQSRGAEITNEIPTYRDPFTYNVWEPLYSNSRMLGSIRMGAKERARSPIFGRVVSREPVTQQRPNPGPGQNRFYGAEGRTANVGTNPGAASPRRSSTNRYMGVSSSSTTAGAPNSVAVQGSFQKLKELIWTERAKELTQQRRAEELAARMAVLKEISNGQNVQSSYKPPFGSQSDLVMMDENRSPDNTGNQFSIDDRISIANGQGLNNNNNKMGYRNAGNRASTRRIGSGGPRRKNSLFSGNLSAKTPTGKDRSRIQASDIIDDLSDKDPSSVIGIPRTYPIRQSHFRERNRSLLKQYTPSEYFQRNTRKLKNFQLGAQRDLTEYIPESNEVYLSDMPNSKYDVKSTLSEILNHLNNNQAEEETIALLPNKNTNHPYDMYDYMTY